jgi:hypothetical protein
MMDYTKEQVDRMIADAVSESKKGLYTQEDFQRELTREVDRRVETGIQKGLDTQKSKWQEEFEKKSRMTAEDFANEQLKAKQAEIDARAKELSIKANRLSALETLNAQGVPKEHYESFLDVLVADDEVVTSQRVTDFASKFQSMKSTLESQIKDSLSKIPQPQKGTTSSEITKDKFVSMSYAEKVALKQSNPELYQQFIK